MTETPHRPSLNRALRGITLTTEPAPILHTLPAPSTSPATQPPSTPPPSTLPVSPRPVDLSEVSWPLVYRIRTEVVDRLAKAIDDQTDEATRLQTGKMLIPDVIKEHNDDAVLTADKDNQIPLRQREAYRKAVESATFGYGRWQPLMDDPDFENFEINGWQNVCMVYPDKIVPVPPVAESDDELVEQLIVMATFATTPKLFSPAHPEMTLNLEDRFRLHAKAFDTSQGGPSIVIRQHKFGALPLTTLAEWGMMPARLPGFLGAAVRARRSFLISGVGGVGKTTFVRALFLEIDELEGVIVIETDAELFLHKIPGRRRTRSFIARGGSAEGLGADGRPLGEYSISQHFRGALRQNVQRVIVGEVRGADEAVPMFESMQQGSGSISTIHAHHADATLERLATAASQGAAMTTEDAYRQMAVNLHLVIHLEAADERSQGGTYRRYVNQIMEIDGLADNPDGTKSSKPATNLIYDARDPNRPLTEHMSSHLREAVYRQGWSGD